MTTHKEPALSAIFGIDPKRKTHSEILDNTLNVFEEAQHKLEDAFVELDKQIAEDQAEVERLQRELEGSRNSLSRIERIRGRFNDLLA